MVLNLADNKIIEPFRIFAYNQVVRTSFLGGQHITEQMISVHSLFLISQKSGEMVVNNLMHVPIDQRASKTKVIGFPDL